MRPRTNDILTVEEWRVAESVASGRSIKEIADHLIKSRNTIVNQIQSAYEKLNLPHNLTALAVWYICKTNSIDLPEFLRKTGAVFMMTLFITTLNSNNELCRNARRSRGRRNEIEIII